MKLLNNKEFTSNAKCELAHLGNIDINTHNKTQHLVVSHDCFKHCLMYVKLHLRYIYLEIVHP